MTSKHQLQDEIYKLQIRIRNLEDALIYAGVFSYDTRTVYSTAYGRVVINEVKNK